MKAPLSLLSRTGFLTVGLFSQGVARFLYTVAIGRLSGPESLGEVNAVLSLAVYISLFWPAALGVAGSRYIPTSTFGEANQNATITYLKQSFWLSTAVSAPVGFALAVVLTGSWETGIAASVLIASYGGYTFVRGTLLGENRVLRVTLVDTLSSLGALTLLLVVISFNATPLLLLPLTVAYMTFSALGWPRSNRSPIAAHLRKQLTDFTRATVVWLVASGGLLPATMLFVQGFSSPREAGVFAAAITLATPANMLAQAFSQVLLPFFSERSENSAVLPRLVARLFLISIGGFTVVFGSLALLTPLLLGFFYGEEYVSGASSMYWLLLGVFLSSSSTVPISALLATGHERSVSLISLVSVAVGTLAMAAFAPYLGIAGILIGFVGSLVISSVVIAVSAALLIRPDNHGHRAQVEQRKS